MTPKDKGKDQGASTAPKGDAKTDGTDAAPKFVEPRQERPAEERVGKDAAMADQDSGTDRPQPESDDRARHDSDGTVKHAPSVGSGSAGEGVGFGGTDTPGVEGGAARTPDTDPAGRDNRTAGQASVAAPANQNRATFGRGEELAAAEAMIRGGVTPAPAFPAALPREEQEENAAAAALEQAKRMTGTDDGVSSVLPVAGGTTNMAMTMQEVLAQVDDEALDAQGRLVGTYLDDMQAAEADRRRELIESAGRRDRELSSAAAERVRALASSPATPAADAGKRPDEQGLVNPDRHTSTDSSDVNDPQRRAAERAETEDRKPASARA